MGNTSSSAFHCWGPPVPSFFSCSNRQSELPGWDKEGETDRQVLDSPPCRHFLPVPRSDSPCPFRVPRGSKAFLRLFPIVHCAH